MMLLDKNALEVCSPSLSLADAPLYDPHGVAFLLRSASRKMSFFPTVLYGLGVWAALFIQVNTAWSLKLGPQVSPGSPPYNISVWVGLLHTMAAGLPGDASKLWEPVEAAMPFSLLLRSYVAWLSVKSRLILNLWPLCLSFLSAGRLHTQLLSYSCW